MRWRNAARRSRSSCSKNTAVCCARPDFHYDAEVVNIFPQMVTAGVSWRAHPRVRLAAQVDWINWSDAFDRLEINLAHGNNADLNGLVGANTMTDFAPLNWRDRFVYRAGVEFAVTENFWLRGGWSYGKSPVPDETLTPLTAAITEHTFSADATKSISATNLICRWSGAWESARCVRVNTATARSKWRFIGSA